MQRYTIFFITVNALHVPGCFSVHHQENKNCTHSFGYVPSLLAATASRSSKQDLVYPNSFSFISPFPDTGEVHIALK
jgi:hypothetical protein